jgi:hypothetical protein
MISIVIYVQLLFRIVLHAIRLAIVNSVIILIIIMKVMLHVIIVTTQ